MKWVSLGKEQGSEEKSQLSRQDDGGMVDGFTAAFNAFKAVMSVERVVELAVVRDTWRRKKRDVERWVFIMVANLGSGWCRVVT